MPDCFTRFALVAWCVGDLEDKQRLAVQDHLPGCPSCSRTVEEIKQNMEVYDLHGPERFQRIRSRLTLDVPSVQPRRTRLGMLSAVGAVSVILLICMALFWKEKTDPIGYKGQMSCKVFVKRGPRQFQGRSGVPLLPKDRLRFVVTTDSSGFLSIFSVDSRGEISLFYPETSPVDDPDPMAITSAGDHQLPDAIELDDTLGEEMVLVLFAKNPFDRRSVHRRLRKWIMGRDFKTLATPDQKLPGKLVVFRFPKIKTRPE